MFINLRYIQKKKLELLFEMLKKEWWTHLFGKQQGSIIINFTTMQVVERERERERETSAMTSRVAMARISAQETLFLQLGIASTAALALITVSNPSPANDRLSG